MVIMKKTDGAVSCRGPLWKDIKHHRGLGGVSWVYLNHPEDKRKVMDVLTKLTGVESVITWEDAVSKFNLYGARIGDLCVFGDKNTVFGQVGSAKRGIAEHLPQPWVHA
jgi:hypothetical protein